MKKCSFLAACLFFLLAASVAKPQKENPLRVLWQFDTEG